MKTLGLPPQTGPGGNWPLARAAAGTAAVAQMQRPGSRLPCKGLARASCSCPHGPYSQTAAAGISIPASEIKGHLENAALSSAEYGLTNYSRLRTLSGIARTVP